AQIVGRSVAERSVLSESRYGAVHEARILLQDAVVSEAKAGHHAWTEPFDDHVRGRQQALADIETGRGFEVYGDAALAAIDRTEGRSRRVDMPRRVTGTRLLDQDDLGPEVRQQHRAIWPRQLLRKAQDMYSRKHS